MVPAARSFILLSFLLCQRHGIRDASRAQHDASGAGYSIAAQRIEYLPCVYHVITVPGELQRSLADDSCQSTSAEIWFDLSLPCLQVQLAFRGRPRVGDDLFWPSSAVDGSSLADDVCFRH